jgi:DNA-binding Xre family transcriptional regulator
MTRLIIRDLAERRGFNITTLARKARLAYTTTHMLWHDTAKVWSRESLDRIAAALEVRVGELFDGEPEPSSGNLEPEMLEELVEA